MAILNQRDYRQAKTRNAQLEKVSHALLGETAAGLSTEITEARRLALIAEHERLSKEIEAYESLRGRNTSTLHTIDPVDLGMLPIVGRIVRGWSQKHLADLLGLKEQQIQRYESERYTGISLSRYERILEILSIDLVANVQNVDTAENTNPHAKLELSSTLVREIQKRLWLSLENGSRDDLIESVNSYIRSGLKLSKTRVFHRQNLRHSSDFEEMALVCWRARVLHVAYSVSANTKGKFNVADMGWLRELVQLSASKTGPPDAISYLREKGIVTIVEPHLPHTRLDGAAFLLATGTPVIALTLRYDRLDYFWFTLLHELGHIFLHFNHGLDQGFMDELEVDGGELEKAADAFARSTLIPDEIWKTAPVRFSKSPEMIKSFAASLGIHVAIVAGRIRQDRKDYSKLWPAPGSADTELGVLMEPEVSHGKAEVYAGVQA
jgi:HTH-type transcriptional regulator / antitoxin HigA